MSLDFLQDAFRKLNEATFDTSVDSLEELDTFMDKSEEEKDTTINVIDQDAEKEEDISDSYVGKVICECPVCHSYVFRNKEDIKYDNNASLANTDEECPYCCEVGGMSIVGQVAIYNPDEGEEEKEEKDDEVVEKEAKSEEEKAEEEAPVDESIENGIGLEPEDKETPDDQPLVEDITDGKVTDDTQVTPDNLDPDKFTGDRDNQGQDIIENVAEQECVPAKRIFAGFEGTEDEFTKALNDCLGEAMWESVELDDEDENAPCEVYCGGKLIGKFLFADDGFYNVDTNECFNYKKESVEESLEEGVSVEINTDNGNAVSVDEDGKVAIENAAVTAETDGDSIVIKAKEDVEEVNADAEGEEVVAPVTPEEIADKADDNAAEEEAVAEEPAEEEVPAAPEVTEEPANDDDSTEEEKEEEDEIKEEGFDTIVDRPMTNLDTESFDKIGEKYLTSIYENVESFKTTDVFADDSKLKIEGLINFKSGKCSKTAFVFEAKDITKSGKARFVGTNESICRGKKAFTLTGTLSDGNYITESLNYNYTARTPSNRSVKVTGTINNK